MNYRVYLIDDDYAEKFKPLATFLTFLSEQFPADCFCYGKQEFHGKALDHNDYLSTQPDQIYSILQASDTLVLLDVRMNSQDHHAAAVWLWSKCAALKLEDSHWEKFDPQKAGDTKLAGAIVTLAKHFGTRIAWASTQTERRWLDTLLHPVAPHIAWDTNAWTAQNTSLITNLSALISGHYLAPVSQAFQEWKRLSDCAMNAQWTINGLPNHSLFPCSSPVERYHAVSAHLQCAVTLEANRPAVEAVLKNWCLSELLRTPAERLAVMKASTRGNQLPLFLTKRVLRVEGDSSHDLTCAIQWSPLERWSSGEMLWSLRAISNSEPAQPTAPRLCGSINPTAVGCEVIFTMSGPTQLVNEVYEILSMGAPRRAAARNGNPGTLNLAVDILKPTTINYSSVKDVATLTLKKPFLSVTL